ncbi:MAG: DUF512 domain-containing protein [Oscillospiraceae bacterium]|nr:DUF512 domain-containing protein [Oscillospiraceae bacterium]
MNAVVKLVRPDSIVSGSIINHGDALRKINCNTINDILDYEYYSYDNRLLLEFISPDKKIKLINIKKPEGADLGIEFEKPLMDDEKHCANKCIFCFIDQLPAAMRESLYYKDDDVRLSFFQGNYVTLTNLSRKDIERIIALRISPVNVSVHTLNPKLRSYILGNKKGGAGLDSLKALAGAGIELNCQIVCCPGVNDGWKLARTIEGLIRLGPGIKSVSIVPAGLTKHREGLTKLHPFTAALARQTIRRVEYYGEKCLKKRGSRVFFCSDELYMLAGFKLPGNEFYENYPQLENGVGMMRLFISEFEIALNRADRHSIKDGYTMQTVITGCLAVKYLTNLLKTAKEKYDKIECEVIGIKNDFFGESVTVSGLVTGGDIIGQLKDKSLGSRVLIPGNMLRAGEDIFLDDITVSQLSYELGVPVHIIKPNGADLLNAILETQQEI